MLPTRVHTRLGPGLLETVYENVLARALEKRGLRVEQQKLVSFEFDGMHFEGVFRLDLLVEGEVVAELKSMENLARPSTPNRYSPICGCSIFRSDC